MDEIQLDFHRTEFETGLPRVSREIEQALREIPRFRFIPKSHQILAYENRAVPIGFGQTISQPYIVALMTQILDPQPTDNILEVGCGSGYQAAVLSKIVKHVHSIEIVPELLEQAQERVDKMGYNNITIHLGDGYNGLEQQAPFDKIIVTAAIPEIPDKLIQQLKIGGQMVIPLEDVVGYQDLFLITKKDQQKTMSQKLIGVRFVPFIRQQ